LAEYSQVSVVKNGDVSLAGEIETSELRRENWRIALRDTRRDPNIHTVFRTVEDDIVFSSNFVICCAAL